MLNDRKGRIERTKEGKKEESTTTTTGRRRAVCTHSTAYPWPACHQAAAWSLSVRLIFAWLNPSWKLVPLFFFISFLALSLSLALSVVVPFVRVCVCKTLVTAPRYYAHLPLYAIHFHRIITFNFLFFISFFLFFWSPTIKAGSKSFYFRLSYKRENEKFRTMFKRRPMWPR